MANPYHDAEGRFCSRDEMVAAVNAAVLANDYTLYSQLRTDLDEADKSKPFKASFFGARKNLVVPVEFDLTRNIEMSAEEGSSFHEGFIDVENMSEESYKLYGFGAVTDDWGMVESSFSLSESREVSQEAIGGLTELEKKVLTNYTWSDHELVNRYLQEGALIDPSDPDLDLSVEKLIYDETINPWSYGHKTLEVYCNKMDDVFAKNVGAKYQRLYRGVPLSWDSGDKWAVENAVVGKVISFPEYLSTSTDVKVADEFTHPSNKIIMEIVTNQGLNVTAVSHVPEEKEVLLPRDTKYVVVGVQKQDTSGTLVVQMVAVDDNNYTLDSSYIHRPSAIPEPYISWERFIEDD